MTNSPQSVEMLYQNHQQWLYEWLRKKTGHSAQAFDLVQDTFVKILQTRDMLLGVHEPRAYLVTIAKNLLLDQMRRKRIEQAYLDELTDMQFMLDILPSVEQQVEIMQAIEQICSLLTHVSYKAQQAFLLHYIDGQTHKEVALQLNVSTKMVQKYLAKCLLQCCKIHLCNDI